MLPSSSIQARGSDGTISFESCLTNHVSINLLEHDDEVSFLKGVSGCIVADGTGGSLDGCVFIRTSRTSFVSERTPPLSVTVMVRRAARTLPSIISLG